jgi:hypothetical protein
MSIATSNSREQSNSVHICQLLFCGLCGCSERGVVGEFSSRGCAESIFHFLTEQTSNELLHLHAHNRLLPPPRVSLRKLDPPHSDVVEGLLRAVPPTAARSPFEDTVTVSLEREHSLRRRMTPGEAATIKQVM